MLATYPLELVYMDFLTIESPHTGVDVNVFVITNHLHDTQRLLSLHIKLLEPWLSLCGMNLS